MSMMRRVMGTMMIAGSLGCGGGSPSGPSAAAPPPPTLTNPATPTTQSGCSATYTCPNFPGVPSVERVTLATGTSASCRTPLLRNQAQTGNLQVEITIRNPQANWFWGTASPNAPTQPMSGGSGNANSTGPFQFTAGFNDIGVPIVTGLEFITVLRLYTFQGGGVPAASTCEVTVYGTVPRS